MINEQEWSILEREVKRAEGRIGMVWGENGRIVGKWGVRESWHGDCSSPCTRLGMVRRRETRKGAHESSVCPFARAYRI
jgi:hypothetical protein